MRVKQQPEQTNIDLSITLKNRFTDLFLKRPEIEKVILFGSRVRGDAAERSDIDLALVVPTATPRQWLDILFELQEIETLLSIDVVRWEEASASLKERISAEGKLLYERYKAETKPA